LKDYATSIFRDITNSWLKKPQGKGSLERSRHLWDNVRLDLGEIGYEVMDFTPASCMYVLGFIRNILLQLPL
jgi:hypothetical protein